MDQRPASGVLVSSLEDAKAEHVAEVAVGRWHEMCRFEEAANEEDKDEQGRMKHLLVTRLHVLEWVMLHAGGVACWEQAYCWTADTCTSTTAPSLKNEDQRNTQ